MSQANELTTELDQLKTELKAWERGKNMREFDFAWKFMFGLAGFLSFGSLVLLCIDVLVFDHTGSTERIATLSIVVFPALVAATAFRQLSKLLKATMHKNRELEQRLAAIEAVHSSAGR